MNPCEKYELWPAHSLEVTSSLFVKLLCEWVLRNALSPKEPILLVAWPEPLASTMFLSKFTFLEQWSLSCTLNSVTQLIATLPTCSHPSLSPTPFNISLISVF